MNGQQLKNSILQMAIQGKLVPQDPCDEPASVLLERIRAEKAKLVKEGKLKKKDLEETPISEDEIPFEIPEGWEWVRLKSIASSITDGDHLPPPQTQSGVPFLVISNVITGTINFNKTRFVPLDYYDKLSNDRKAKKNDILFTVTGSYGKAIIVSTDKTFCFQRHIALIRPLFFSGYLLHCLNSPYIKSECDNKATGMAQKTVGLDTLRSFLIPLPPLNEQHRIVEKIEELLPKVEEYDKAQQALDKLNNELPEQLKKSILQEAIQGRLVPQDPNDEPASVLLDKIRKEKEKLVKDGKLKKKDLEEKPISPDEIPFDIPEGWEWCRLNNLINLTSGQDLVPSRYSDVADGIPYITGASNFINGGIIVNRYTTSPTSISHLGDLLITCKGTVGKMAYNIIGDIHIARQIMAISSLFIHLPFIQYYIEANLSSIEKEARSMIPGISRDTLLSLIIPIPPLAEQRRIVKKIEEILSEIEKLHS